MKESTVSAINILFVARLGFGLHVTTEDDTCSPLGYLINLKNFGFVIFFSSLCNEIESS